MSGGIFISYRREDSAGFAGRIYDRLTQKLEREQVFFDVDNIEPGLDFVQILSDRVGACDALVAIIGKDWLSISDREYRRRLDDPNDFVRIEIEAALKRNIRVIPVLIDGATMPRQDELPDGLKMLARRGGIEISHTRFVSDTDRLARALGFVEEERRKRDAAEAERLAREERERQEAAEAARKAEGANSAAPSEERRRADDNASRMPEERGPIATDEAVQGGWRARGEEAKASPPASPSEVVRPQPKGSLNWGVLWSLAGVVAAGAILFFWTGTGGPRNPRLSIDPATTNASVPTPTSTSQVQETPIATPSTVTPTMRNVDDDPLVKECDRLAASPFDKSRPPGVPGVNFEVLDSVKAIPACRAALAKFPGTPRVQFDLARALGISRSFDEEFVLNKRAADVGYAAAQVNLGANYLDGHGVPRDYAQALVWFRKAADQDYAVAQYRIGRLYANGQGVTQDYAQAMAWYKKAADQGNADAEVGIGLLYYNGHGVTQDYAQALIWFRKAADQDYAVAQYRIGRLYANGQGVTQDYAQAMAWYKKAADQGNADAEVGIGLLYYNGHGVTQDYAQALIWFRKAADQDYAVAQYDIGLLYERGEGVAQDSSQARVWYQKAADQGDSDAKAALTRLAGK